MKPSYCLPLLLSPCSSAVEHTLGKGEVSGSSPDEGIAQNPQASNPPTQQEKEKSIEGLEGIPHKNNFKNKNNSKKIKIDLQTTLETLQPSIAGSAWDTNSDDEDPFWNE